MNCGYLRCSYVDGGTDLGGNRCGFKWGLAFMPYGDPWRDSRRIAHQEFRSGPVKRFRPIEQKVSTQFLVNLYRHPEKLMYNLRQYVLSLSRYTVS